MKEGARHVAHYEGIDKYRHNFNKEIKMENITLWRPLEL
jgi:hypothetical protein